MVRVYVCIGNVSIVQYILHSHIADVKRCWQTLESDLVKFTLLNGIHSLKLQI